MATAISTTIINASHTATTVMAGIVSAMQSAGFTLLTQWNLPATQGGEFHAAFIPNFDYPPNAKKPILEIYYSNTQRQFFTVFYDGYSSINTSTGSLVTPTNASVLISNGAIFESANQIQLTSFNGVDFKGILFFHQRNVGVSILGTLGIVRPFYKPTWWNEQNHVYAFMSNSAITTFNSFIPSGLNPLGLASSSTLTLTCQFDPDASYQNGNPNTTPSNQREIKRFLTLNQPTGGGIIAGSVGQCLEIVTISGSGLKFLDDFKPNPGTEEYIALSDGGTPVRAIRSV
jgi:hypothetical protein